jgi:hypothetical protein
MKWIFYSLLLANLAYLAFNLRGQGTARAGATGNAGDSVVKNAGRWGSGFDQKGTRSLFLLGDSRPGKNPTLVVMMEQPTLVAVADELKSCMGLGPFENVNSAQDVAERLKAIGYTVEMTAVDKPTGESDYRVVMPPVSSLQEAFRRHREFKSRDIDSFVITKGVDAQGISLGVFSSNGVAENYRADLIGLGYDVLVKVIPRVNRGYWVQINQERFPEALLSAIATEFIEVEVTETGCMNE